jgi:hypothetical protein
MEAGASHMLGSALSLSYILSPFIVLNNREYTLARNRRDSFSTVTLEEENKGSFHLKDVIKE